MSRRLSDKEKLNNILIDYCKDNDTFTSGMVYNYINTLNIKFKKDMSIKQISSYISSMGKFDKFKKKNKLYYTIKK